MTCIAVHQNRIHGCHDTVADDRISSLFKIQIAADMVDDNEVLMDALLQMGDRLVQAHAVEAALLFVGKKSLHIFERTGHFRLAMPLHDGHVDQKIDPVHHICDLQLHAGTVDLMPFFLLGVNKRHTVLFRQSIVAAVVKSQRGPVTYPGALRHNDIMKFSLLQVLNDTGNDLCVRRAAELRGRCDHQIRLDPDPGLSVPDPVGKIRSRQDFFCHLFIIRTINFPYSVCIIGTGCGFCVILFHLFTS